MYIYGRNPIVEAIRAGKTIAKIFLRFGVHGNAVEEVRRHAREHGIQILELPRQKFDRLGNTTDSQGIVALIEEALLITLDELLALRHEQDPPFFIAVDGVTDPRNLGAILRSAECAGAHGVILPQRDSSPITDTVMKTSAGATAHLPIARVGNLHQALLRLKDEDIWIAGLDADGDTDLLALDGYRPLCLVVGSEGKGLRRLTRDTCDALLRIPMWGRISSLNASVAAALALYEIRRTRL
ncbi:MAG TPA: 23S rRNA (guanosine(2251)-2'-O)-methyltransferase RlmB [Bacteroidota bacterium]|jgi:23S rRNA (guanosine2251-2'-O)-methyltransferase|nr:23S rRNA (guanosine(2251)-2'-O)-methyltransferase RlmB [Bacteroidota bacterium]